MADEVDNANDQADAFLAEQIRQARTGTSLKPKGTCHWCDTEVKGDLLFCDADCAHDWQREQHAKRRTGAR